MASHKRKVVYFFLLAATLSIIAGASANPVSLEDAESSLNQDLELQDEQRWENKSEFETPNESSTDEERLQRQQKHPFWHRVGMNIKHFINGFREG
ncbi:uncharacterized protein LOC124350823 isoform X3 [Daphnia pulicaria]|uniref:uncharacterized protein LOC124350823 isoform X3 n=1 Tax=Daphnia pulicaria TaxID=35523 RepID=UPI001EEB1B40|nr:uncharacterized protein LOC124350823 isoform X3 [Daphnia pulicaria]